MSLILGEILESSSYTYEFTASQSGTYQFEFSVITKSYSPYVNYCHADANVNGQINVTSLG